MQLLGLRLSPRCVLFLIFMAAFVRPSAAGQDFSMTATDLSPSPVDQGVAASSTLTIQGLNGFAGQVNLQCSVSPQVTNGPTCLFSQSSVTPPAQPSVSLITAANTPAQLYTLTLTATSPSSPTVVTVPLTDTVVVVVPDYTMTIFTALSPTSLHAGNQATAVIAINPISYSGTVTPVCASISPAVEFSPICSFNPSPITVTGAAPVNTTLTISTSGPTTTTGSLIRSGHRLLALWLLPGLAFCGISLRSRPHRSRLRRWVGLLSLAFAFALLPSCNLINGSSSTTNTTPKNTYTLTISGVDANQVGPSNSSVTVTLTVD